MPGRKAHSNPPRPTASPNQGRTSAASAQPPTVSLRWLAAAIGVTIVAAAVCAWGALCLMVWQGSWQLLYHPTAAVTRTPAGAGLPFDSIGFATTEAGLPRLKGWWIPAPPGAVNSRYTALYLHGATGNLGDSVDELYRLHAAGLNVLAFDYRGYGGSQFVHPSEDRWRQDAEWALQYLTGTRHVAAKSIVLVGSGLGANLALEVAAAHSNLAGVVLDEPLAAPANAIFADPRTRLVPARALVRDRWNSNASAVALHIPSLWFYFTAAPGIVSLSAKPELFQKAPSPKMLFWLISTRESNADFANALSRWLSDLPNHGRDLPVCQLSDGLTC